MKITLDNVNEVLGSTSQGLARNLTQVFSKLQEPNQDITFVLKYTDAIKAKLEERAEVQVRTGTTGLDRFGETCLSTGIVKTMLGLARLSPSTTYRKEVYMTQYKAIASLSHLFRTSDEGQRTTLLGQFLSQGIIDILLRVLNHHLVMFRYLAADMLRTICTVPLVTGKFATAETGDIIVALCQLAMQGPDNAVEQLQNPALDWQRELPDKEKMPTLREAVHLPRDLALYQEYIIWGVRDFLWMNIPLSCKYSFELLKQRPEILDVLFDCAIIPRPVCFPESSASSAAAETLALLFSWPAHIVPGVSTPMDSAFKTQHWKALSRSLSILTSWQDWVEKIIETWMQVEEEDDYAQIRWMIERAQTQYPTAKKYVDVSLLDVAKHRGMIRISILRILATLTHAAESCGVTNAEIESFFRIAYTASYKIRQPEGRLAPFELISYAERNVQNAERPECAHLFHSDIGPPHRIAKESVLGPTALARLLVVLAQRGTLDTIQGLKKAPSGLSSCTSLAHVQQITHPDIIRRFLTIALDRVNACIEQGRLDVKVNQFYSAQVSFTSSAELAAALMALDTHTKGQYSKEIQGARKQLVIALGNASQMALNQEKSLEALSFGHGALSAAENIPASEGLHQNIVEKIKLRIQKAQESMQKS